MPFLFFWCLQFPSRFLFKWKKKEMYLAKWKVENEFASLFCAKLYGQFVSKSHRNGMNSAVQIYTSKTLTNEIQKCRRNEEMMMISFCFLHNKIRNISWTHVALSVLKPSKLRAFWNLAQMAPVGASSSLYTPFIYIQFRKIHSYSNAVWNSGNMNNKRDCVEGEQEEGKNVIKKPVLLGDEYIALLHKYIHTQNEKKKKKKTFDGIVWVCWCRPNSAT